MSTNILIIEDDEDSRETLADILEMEGYKVACVGNGDEALVYLRHASRPDLILLDLMMPVMDGWAFRKEQKRHTELSEIPVVVLSGDGNVAQKAASVDAADYLMKPINLDRLFDAVNRLLPG